MAARSTLSRGRRSLLTVLAVTGLFALVPTAALAFWSTLGGGTGGATTANLSAPTSVTASATSSGDVTVAWTAPATKPTGSTVAYRVFRSGSTTAVCGTATSATTQTTCTDAAPPSGSYTYTVQAVLNSWTATSAASNSVTVGSATKLAFTLDPVTGTASQTANIGPITVALRDANNRAAVAPAAVSVSLSSSSRRSIFAATQNGTGVTTVSIPAGSSSVDFYYGDQKSGTPTLTASSTGLTSATQSETINAGPASAFGVTTASAPTAGQAFSVQLSAVDQFGNAATNYSGSKTVTWSGASASPNGTTPTYPATSVTFNTTGVATTTLNATLVASGANTLVATAGSMTGSAAVSVGAGAPKAAAYTNCVTTGSASSASCSASGGTSTVSLPAKINGASSAPAGTWTADVTLIDLYGNVASNAGATALPVLVTYQTSSTGSNKGHFGAASAGTTVSTTLSVPAGSSRSTSTFTWTPDSNMANPYGTVSTSATGLNAVSATVTVT